MTKMTKTTNVWEFELTEPPRRENLIGNVVLAAASINPMTLKIRYRGEEVISFRGVPDPDNNNVYAQMWATYLQNLMDDLNRVSEVTTEWGVQDDLGRMVALPASEDHAKEFLEWFRKINEQVRIEAEKQKVSVDAGQPDWPDEYIAWFRHSDPRQFAKIDKKDRDGGIRRRTYKIVSREVTPWR